ncbi:hypothetical protein OLX02_06305 [Novosphingobium sp. KCTC 2891]|uniref:hypothetical protein n=1 Tax=Novosphingobium sp. KCTC 2891 TaxID=2989730 RepID=UPI002222E424|nr:hypothetical protein [Novosphingobium sp. KCTC 2891]MCW1382428.1 hypothetical protein [Novosphingobium sp. KCTC 2891]
MGAVRDILMRHRTLAMLLVALSLAIKALVPAGYMPGQTATKSFTILICADATGDHGPRQVTVPQGGAKETATKAHENCAFAGLGFAALAGADPVLLALALAFIVALGFGPIVLPRLARASRVLPPPCGPPALS